MNASSFKLLLLVVAGFSRGFGQSEIVANLTASAEPEVPVIDYDDRNLLVKKNGTEGVGNGENQRVNLVRGVLLAFHRNDSAGKDDKPRKLLIVSAMESNFTGEIVRATEQSNIQEKKEGPSVLLMLPAPSESAFKKIDETEGNRVETTTTTETITSTADVKESMKSEEILWEESKSEIEYSTPSTPGIFSFGLKTALLPENKIAQDIVEKQINDAINAMPKLPELVLSDNKTHLKLHKSSEEMLMDEKITKTALQLAEESLRKQYEKEKLRGDAGVESPYINDAKLDRRLSPLKVLVEAILQASTQVPGKSEAEREGTYETVTNLPRILKMNKTEGQIEEIDEMVHAREDILSSSDLPAIHRALPSGEKKMAEDITEESPLLFSLLTENRREDVIPPANDTYYSRNA